MTQPKHNPTTSTPLTKRNLEKVSRTSTTKLETFIQTSEISERLALGIPSRAPQTDMKATLESWEEQWGSIAEGANNDRDMKVATANMPHWYVEYTN
jgi:hypothetical protein